MIAKRWVDASAVGSLQPADAIDATAALLGVAKQSTSVLAVPVGVNRETAVVRIFQRAIESINAAEGIMVKAQIARDMLAFRAVVSAYKLSLEVEMRAAEATVLCMRSLGLALVAEYPNMNAKQRGAASTLGTYPCLHAVTVATPPDDVLDETFVWLREHGIVPSIGKVMRALRRRKQYGSLDRAERVRPVSPRNQYALAVIYPSEAASCRRAIDRIEVVRDMAIDEDAELKAGVPPDPPDPKHPDARPYPEPFRADERHFFETLLAYLRAHHAFLVAQTSAVSQPRSARSAKRATSQTTSSDSSP